VGTLTIATAVVCGIVTARTLGKDSPLVWTVALLAAIGVGMLLVGNPALHRIAERLERAGEEGIAESRSVNGDSAGHGDA